ncbi:hypothetical protein SAMN02787118_13254 [Streptomyces mirabilis]|uniref:Uncharacterized protein n=1 Tax=Streptomyces mirabilis TaxID=68239 RepID=A0A1I2VL63_9ACTN|nr:hypothetical protein SAMN02787118_13254 [Streptomyces mirabilis]
MDVLVICPAAGFRRSLDLETLESHLGVIPLRFDDLLHYLVSEFSELQELHQTQGLTFQRVDQSGSYATIPGYEAVRIHASEGTIYLQPNEVAMLPPEPSGTHPARSSQQTAEPRSKRSIILLVSIAGVVLIVVIAVVLGSQGGGGGGGGKTGNSQQGPATSNSPSTVSPLSDPLTQQQHAPGWQEDAYCRFTNEGYLVGPSTDTNNAAMCQNSGLTMRNGEISVTVTLLKRVASQDPDSQYFFDDGYGLAIDSAGSGFPVIFAIRDNGVLVYSTGEVRQEGGEKAVIRRGVGAANVLTIRIRAPEFELLVNGVQVATLRVDEPSIFLQSGGTVRLEADKYDEVVFRGLAVSTNQSQSGVPTS